MLLLAGCDRASTSPAAPTSPASNAPAISAGPDFEVIPVSGHVTTTIYPDGRSTAERIYPAPGYQFVVAYPKRPEVMQPDAGTRYVKTHLVAWSGQNAMLPLGRSTVDGREDEGYLLVGPAGGDYRVSRVTPAADLIGFTQLLQGRSLPNDTLWTSTSREHAVQTLIHAPVSNTPAVTDALADVAMGRSPFVERERIESGGRVSYQTRAVPEEDSFKLRAECAFAVWLLTDGGRPEPLAAILDEQHRRMAASELPIEQGLPDLYFYDLRETSLVNPLVEQHRQRTLDETMRYVDKLETLYEPLPTDVPPVYPRMPGERRHQFYYLHPFTHVVRQLEEDADDHRLMIALIKSDVELVSLMAGEYYYRKLIEDAAGVFYYFFQAEGSAERSEIHGSPIRVSVIEEGARGMIELMERIMALTEEAPDRRATRIAIHRIRENAGRSRDIDRSRPRFGPDRFPLIMQYGRDDPLIQQVAGLFQRFDKWAEEHPLTEEDRRMSNPRQAWRSGVHDPAR